MTENKNVISFVRKYPDKCRHEGVFYVDPSADTVECSECGERLNPMWALKKLCDRESRAEYRLKTLQKQAKEEKEKIEEARQKARCKCRNCGKMTPILKFNQ